MSRHIGNLAGVARPTARMAALLGKREVTLADVLSMVEREDAIHRLARILDRGLESGITTDGRLDLREVAAFVLKEVALGARGKV